MDLASWLISLIVDLLTKANLPGFVVAFIKSQLEHVITGELITKLEEEVLNYFLTSLDDLADQFPDAAPLILEVKKLLTSCDPSDETAALVSPPDSPETPAG